MTFSAYSEDRKSLQFPAFCDGYVNIDAGQSIAATGTGLWGHTGGITVEMIVTPYDVNGDFDKDNGTSHKSLKSLGSGGDNYFDRDQRINSAMTLLKNSAMSVVLNNTTTYRKRQPAEYSVSFSLTVGGTTTTITSPTIITTSPVVRNAYVDPSKFLFNNHEPFAEVANQSGTYDSISSVITGANTFVTNNWRAYAEGMTVYDENNNNLGTVQSINTVTGLITMQDIGTSFSTAYIPVAREATYLEIPHHIAVSYDPANKAMAIIYNNKIVAKSKHGAGGKFSFNKNDIYLGQDPSALISEENRRKSQFFGEYHEIAISSIPMSKFTNINTLSPMFRKLLLYIDFEESNLIDG